MRTITSKTLGKLEVKVINNLENIPAHGISLDSTSGTYTSTFTRNGKVVYTRNHNELRTADYLVHQAIRCESWARFSAKKFCTWMDNAEKNGTNVPSYV